MRPYLKNKLGMVVCACDSSYMDGGFKRMALLGVKSVRPYLKNN
jgi:hypothetical protein